MKEVKLIGLYVSQIFLSPFLKIAVMLAIRHVVGTSSYVRGFKLLKIRLNGGGGGGGITV